jgi:hypothetical protein
MDKKTISTHKRTQAVALFDVEFKISRIVCQLNISWTRVINAINRYREHNTFKKLLHTAVFLQKSCQGLRIILNCPEI